MDDKDILLDPKEMTVHHVVLDVSQEQFQSGPHPYLISGFQSVKESNMFLIPSGSETVDKIQSEHAYNQTSDIDPMVLLLRQTEEYISFNYPDILTVIMEIEDHSPLLVAFLRFTDKFLRDQPCLHLNISPVENTRSLMAELMTSNRQLIDQCIVSDMKTDLRQLLEEMIDQRYHTCTGLEIDVEHLWEIGLSHVLVEKYGEHMVARSRDCTFIVDTKTNSQQNSCDSCNSLNSRILVTETSLEYSLQLDSKKNRGRPKGSKNRKNVSVSPELQGEEDLNCNDLGYNSIVQENYDFPQNEKEEQRPLVVPPINYNITDITTHRSIIDEEAIDMDNNMRDEDPHFKIPSTANPKRGSMKKILSQKFLEMKTDRMPKRPKVMLPIACPEEEEPTTDDNIISNGKLSHRNFPLVLVNEDGKYPCDQCDYQASQQSHIKRHKISAHLGITINCDQCSYLTSDPSKLIKHRRRIHERVPHQCDLCEFQSRLQKTISKHRRVVHGVDAHKVNEENETIGSYRGPYVNKYLISNDQISYSNIQLVPMNQDGKYHCDQCDYQSETQKNIKKHKLKIHEGVTYDCDKCAYRATESGHLKRHKRDVHDDAIYKCDMCEFQAKFKVSVLKHKQNIHNKVKGECQTLAINEGAPYKCDMCEFQSSYHTTITKHRRIVHRVVEHNVKEEYKKLFFL